MSMRSRSRSPVKFDRDSGPKSMLLFRNLPRQWSYERIKGFVNENTSAGRLVAFVDVKNSGESTVKFASCSAARKAYDDLYGLSVEGKKIEIMLIDAKSGFPPKKEWGNHNPPRHNQHPNHKQRHNSPPKNEPPQEKHETFGLSTNFLKSLVISPPLSNKLFVFNLSDQVDEAKIREVFGMAGHIVAVILKNKIVEKSPNDRMKVTAKIEFDHPVEAVQAIAMFNNQELYDRPMMMRLDHLIKGPLRKHITGLKGIGQALGENGEPMRNVRQFLELQSLKQEINERFNSVTNNQQSGSNGNQMANVNNPMNNMGGQMGMTNQMVPNIPNQMTNDPTMLQNQMMAMSNINANAFNPGFLLNPLVTNTNTFQPWAGMMANTMGMMQNQTNVPNPLTNVNIPVTNPAVVQSNMNSYQGNQSHDDGSSSNWSHQQNNFDKRGDTEGYDKVFKDDNMDLSEMKRESDRHRETSSETLVFKYLPPSVNLGTLQQKMREIGEIKFVEMTGHGRAIVRFMSTRDAEQCIRMYDRSRVDGQIIEVKYF